MWMSLKISPGSIRFDTYFTLALASRQEVHTVRIAPGTGAGKPVSRSSELSFFEALGLNRAIESGRRVLIL